jgi:hypothetical protein
MEGGESRDTTNDWEEGEKESEGGGREIEEAGGGGGDRGEGANYFQNPDARGRVLSFSLLVIDNIV